MKKSKKQKNYDICISPGKRYLYKTRIILFLLSMLSFILNMALIAGFDESMRKNALISILLSAIFTILQLVDDRKAHWDWLYIIVLSSMFLFLSAFSVFATHLIFMRFIWAGEFVAFCGFTLFLLRKKKKD